MRLVRSVSLARAVCVRDIRPQANVLSTGINPSLHPFATREAEAFPKGIKGFSVE